jgi:choline dehydrogenase-like flavoprotein
MLYPRGAALGGSSVTNAMGFVYPPDEDWNDMARLTGDASWSALNMRRHFERLERCHYKPIGTAGHGFDGYISASEMLHQLQDRQLILIVKPEQYNSPRRNERAMGCSQNCISTVRRGTIVGR